MNVRRAPWQAGRQGARRLRPRPARPPAGRQGERAGAGFGPRPGPRGEGGGAPGALHGDGPPGIGAPHPDLPAARIPWRSFRRRACAGPNRALYLDGQAARA